MEKIINRGEKREMRIDNLREQKRKYKENQELNWFALFGCSSWACFRPRLNRKFYVDSPDWHFLVF